MMLAKKYLLFAMIILSLNVGGCGLLGNMWYITFDYSLKPIASKPFFFHKKGNAEEFVVEIKDRRTYELALLTEEEIFHGDIIFKKPLRWTLEVAVWSGDKLVERQVLGKAVTASPFQGINKRGRSFDYMSLVCLGNLPSLKSSWLWNKTYTVRVKVKEVDERFTDGNLPARVVIRPNHRK